MCYISLRWLGEVLRLEIGDFSLSYQALGCVVRMVIFFAKTRPFHFQISKIFACGAQKVDLWYPNGVSAANKRRIRMYVWVVGGRAVSERS